MATHWVAPTWGPPSGWELVHADVPTPRAGEVTIRVRAAGVNPADAKHVAAPRPGATLPVPLGYEVSGELIAIGPETRIGSGDARLGDAVLAFRVYGGYATDITVPAEKVFAKPAGLSHEAAANLLLAGTTASEMLHVTRVADGETILLHGASGAVGVMVLQLARLRGIRVVGTASRSSFGRVEEFGGIPIAYGEGLAQRAAEAAGGPIAASLDAVGTDEAVDVSLDLVADRSRIVTIAAAERARTEGFTWIVGSLPASAEYRDGVRSELIALAGAGDLVVPVSRTYPLAEAREAISFVLEGHAGGKVALTP